MFVMTTKAATINFVLQVFRFCRSKCHNAFKKKRNPRKVKWTKAFRKSHGKELSVDSAFEFEKRRNVPVKYDRKLWNSTSRLQPDLLELYCVKLTLHGALNNSILLHCSIWHDQGEIMLGVLFIVSSLICLLCSIVKAMKRIEEIKRKREGQHIVNRYCVVEIYLCLLSISMELFKATVVGTDVL